VLAKGLKRSTANRYLKALAACLSTTARLDERIENTKAWKLRALPDATDARNVILKETQVRAVSAAAYGINYEFGLLVEVLAVSGARVSQAARLTVGDLQTARVMMPPSRKGKKKHTDGQPIPIPASLAAKLRTAAGDRPDHARLLLRHDGEPWGPSEHQRPFRLATKAAGLDPDVVTAYALRHTSIVRQLLANVPTRVVAAHHDTSVKMIEAHYSKYIGDHSDALIRPSMLDLDMAPVGDNIFPMVR
jgi:integrase